MNEVSWKVEPHLIRQILDGTRPIVHSLKAAVLDIQGQHVRLSFALCDKDDETLLLINSDYLTKGSILTLANLERSINITVSGDRCPTCEGRGRIIQVEPWKAPVGLCGRCNELGVV